MTTSPKDVFYPGRRSGRSGFTLIEVLVVMAILAVLLSLLLPALGRARELVKMTTCQSNMRQLGIGMLRYTQENNDCYPFSAANSTTEDWVWWEPGRNIAIGGIAPYIMQRFNAQIYTCPSDDMMAHPGWPGSGTYPFSYSMNINIGGYWPSGDGAAPSIPTIHLGKVHRPSNCILMVEETEDTLDDGCWAWQSSYGSGRNILSARHDQHNRELALDPSNPTAGRGNCLYCDGHVSFTTRADSWLPQFWNPTY